MSPRLESAGERSAKRAEAGAAALPWRGSLIRVALALAVLLLPVVLLRDLSLSRATDLIRDLGPIALLIPLPFALSLLVDTISWRVLFASLGRRLSLSRLLLVRVSTEAVLASGVGGGLVGEGAAPVLLQRQGVPPGETVATCAVRKALHLLAQATYLFLGGLLAIVFTGLSALGSVAVAAGVVIGTVALLWLRAMKSGSFAARLQGVLARVLPARCIRPVGALGEAADRSLKQTLGAPLLRTFVGFLAVWLLEVFETWLILRLLGAEVSYVEVWAFEPLAALIRHLAFFVPAGVGFQDASYVLFLAAAGPDRAAAFILLKRIKEILWIGIGGMLLPLSLRRLHEDAGRGAGAHVVDAPVQ